MKVCQGGEERIRNGNQRKMHEEKRKQNKGKEKFNGVGAEEEKCGKRNPVAKDGPKGKSSRKREK